ncbi:protein suppressor 2 of zeste-like [Planococcus citri]|uniref:protein suppressor 2 of zeste-like n=1 Tax=Planococcus citri TaxID=170843 RepID=UPI0031F96A35
MVDIVSKATDDLSISSMKQSRKPLLKELNHFLTCFLCNGYFFNATTIVECSHTYCRACIVNFLKTEKFCPACHAQGHRTKSNLNLRYDAILQKLVYKTVPGLYQSELERRNSHLEEARKSEEETLNGDDRLDEEYYFSPDEPINISLEYIDNKIDGQRDIVKSSVKVEDIEKEQVKRKRYLQCPAKLTIGDLYKFIKLKYNLQQNQRVEVLYDNTKLPGSFSLMDVAYTFSWKRDSPMRLCYQILECILIKVPQTVAEKMSDESVPVKNNVVTNSSSPSNIGNAVQTTNDMVQLEETTKIDNLSTKVNLKRKLEVAETITSNAKDPTTDDDFKEPVKKEERAKENSELPGHGLLVKVPRISNATFKDIVDFKKESHEDKPKPTATVSPCNTENGLKLPLKSSPACEDFNDDYMKYEQDIEEVEDDDDEDDDRLRISQLSEEDTQDDKAEDNSDQNLVIETSDMETASKEDLKEQKLDDDDDDVSKKSTKYKRKSKKSKHSHHHKHRHHERKSKGTPQATILHSPDTDIMKLKLKLNNVKPDVKYHKQKRKRKKSSECYFSSSFSSSSSVSSINGMSPDAHNTSRVDEDSLHSHTSELSTESVDIAPPKEETTTKPVASATEPADKYQSPTSQEKLLQMRAFRPRSVAVVKPEENHKLEKPVEKPTKNDNNNNDSTSVIESKEKAKPTSPVILKPPSSITVSKLTAAEIQKMEQNKLLIDDKPSVDIMVVNGPPKSFVLSTVSSTTDVTSKPKTPPRPTRPPPAAIPIEQYQKMKSNEQTPNIPKSLTIIPPIHRSKATNETFKKSKDAVSAKEVLKRSITSSSSGNLPRTAFSGALDLSSGFKSPSVSSPSPPKYPVNVNVPHSMPNKKVCMNGVHPMQNVIRSMQNGAYSKPNGSNMFPYPPVRSLPPCTDVHSFHKHYNQNRPPINSSLKHKIPISSPQASPKHIPSRLPNHKPNKPNVPKLNEIKIGPMSSSIEMMPKPGPNQSVRQIPDPSVMLKRHQANVNISSTNGTDFVSYKLPHSSIMNHRNISGACSFSSMKKASDKCPPAIPLKGYYDITTVMATK